MEKTEALAPVEQKLVDFNGAEIMAVKCNDGKIRIAVKWVCSGIGLSDGQYQNQTRKLNEDVVLSKGIAKMRLPTQGGNQEVLCLELDFLPLWLAKINANIIDAPEIQQKLIDFQLHAKDALADAFLARKKRPVITWDRVAIGEIRFAKEFAKAVGIRPERAVAVALARIEKETGKQLADYRKELPAVEEQNAELLTPSQIGAQFNLKANKVNLLLEEMGLQYGIREAGKTKERLVKRNPWRLTEKGKDFGIMQDSSKQMTIGKWEGFQIFWSEKTVGTVRDFLAQKGSAEVNSDLVDNAGE
ncbi:hypothetical protein CEB3_c18640 [Peptococcaceae bacterium CEB3]|nr:hypothetical protein CEB3_c18640 [Peptococcaceae bacterium CEB3]